MERILKHTKKALNPMVSRIKKNRSKYPSEAQEQEQLCKWLTAKNVCYFAVPNGGLRLKRTGAQLKKQGVKAGVPDLLIIDHPNMVVDGEIVKFVGVALELKRQSERPKELAEDLRDQPFKGASESQRAWLNRFSKRGWISFVAYGALDAMLKLVACGILPIESFNDEERLLLGLEQQPDQSDQSDHHTPDQTADDELYTQESDSQTELYQGHQEDDVDM